MVYSAIHNIAALEDHARAALKKHSLDSASAAAIAKDPAVQIIKDLSNTDKHGSPSYGGHSGMSPRLGTVHRSLQLKTGPSGGVSGTMFTRTGLQPFGDVSPEVVTSANVLDGDGSPIGEPSAICMGAMRRGNRDWQPWGCCDGPKRRCR
jgi:hypothetical protein